MRRNFIYYFLVALLVFSSCATETVPVSILETALASEEPSIKKVMDSLDTYEIQIRYTQIDKKQSEVIFTDYDFQVADSTYFYPASTVKFPIAVLALEKLNTIDSLSMDTRFYVEGDSVETTFAQEITKIFAVSDNKAYNRLFEFLGQDLINQQLTNKGITPVRIAHRLSTTNANEITTKPLIIYQNDSTTIPLSGTINTSAQPLLIEGIEKGIGFYETDSLMQAAFDFGLKNYYPIKAQQGVLKRVIFPEKYTKNEQFNLSETQRLFLLKSMHALPKSQGYNPEEYYDSYVKFFIYGDNQKPMPAHIKIYNKVGYAYGTLTDCAYIVDSKNEVEFMLTATILVNKDGIFNDDAYEYDTVGIPFLAALGREIYQLEMNRKNKHNE